MRNNGLRAHALSNGAYSIVVTPQGGGYAALNGYAITRWTPAPDRNGTGWFCYLRDLATGEYWTLTEAPRPGNGATGTMRRRGGVIVAESLCANIEASCEVFVARDSNAEVRRVRISNRDTRPRTLDFTTYCELALNALAADAAHPAFSKLFVQTGHNADHAALVAWRRPRSPGDRRLVVAQRILKAPGAVRFETDRTRFIGRSRSIANPQAMEGTTPLSGTVGTVLDPVFCLRVPIALEPGADVSFDLVTYAADSMVALERMLAAHDQLVPAQSTKPLSLDSVGLPDRWSDRLTLDAVDHSWTAGTRVAVVGPDRKARADFGSFNERGDEYVLQVGGGLEPTPQPWINVLANEQFGCLISESGAGYTWAVNSRENRITHWSNDPVVDPPGETLILEDVKSGRSWSAFPGPGAAQSAFEVRHGFGYSSFSAETSGLSHYARVFVPRHDPVRIVRLTIINQSAGQRRLAVTSDAQLVLGSSAADTHKRIAVFESNGVVYATNSARAEFSDRVAFTCAVPDTMPRRAGRFGVTVELAIPPGATRELAFLLGEAESRGAADACLARYGSLVAIDDAFSAVTSFWQELLSAVHVQTPEPALDVLLNGWLAYQNLACRMWARSAFYQSGGAFGFRDQLQDAAALLYLDQQITRNQILLHAAHQFVEGDVLHWWHPPTSKGIRTRFSDDLLWLPYITLFYIARTGDAALLDENARFLTADLLDADDDEIFVLPADTGAHGSIYEHCCRALDRSLTSGAHGLPLMGVGDWNDGMNRVGREGRGESVWLGFFLFDILHDFIPICEARGDVPRADRYRAYLDDLAIALNESGWDGAWYRRAYYDNGAPLGSRHSDECRIDALAQAWAVISRAAPAERAESALSEMRRHLINEQDGIIRLLAPPFDRTPHDPGYIKGYVPGVRENGGQYTHAALWAVRAIAEMGDRENAVRLLTMLTPVRHTSDRQRVMTYQSEPYVIAADVYGVAPHVGRAGWTWYTGSAGWMYRVLLESILGINVDRGEALRLCPCVPSDWPGFTVSLRLADDTTYVLNVQQSDQPSRTSLGAVAGSEIVIPIVRDGGRHNVDIVLGSDVGPAYRARLQSMPEPLR